MILTVETYGMMTSLMDHCLPSFQINRLSETLAYGMVLYKY